MGKFKKKTGKQEISGRENEKSPVRAKKHLGQHFLTDENIAKKIGETLSFEGYSEVLEIGPGTGVLTKYLLKNDIRLTAMDLDRESIAYLKESFSLEHPNLVHGNNFRIMEADFLKCDLRELFGNQKFAITGNFPYNISTQIVFKMLEYRNQIPEFSGMFQKEVAQRICEKAGSKTYGILSVLVQAFYETEYLFTVNPQVFNPPPKVESGVLRLVRKENDQLACDEKLFFQVVKTAFQQRRKTLWNSLKIFNISEDLKEDSIFAQRSEQLDVPQFVSLTQKIAKNAISDR